nr:MAG TPA: hypothetical protein [Caudoviricetes sp.]
MRKVRQFGAPSLGKFSAGLTGAFRRNTGLL